MAGSGIRRLLSIPTPVIFLISIAVAIALLWQQGAISDIAPAVRQANIWQILAGLLLYLVGLGILCLRWHLLAIMIKGGSDGFRASEAFVTSVAVNYAAPLSLALPSRALLTKRSLGMTATETTALTFWEVVADLLFLTVLSCIWIIAGGWRGEGINPDETLIGLSLLVLAVALITVGLAIVKIGRLRSIAQTARSRVSAGLGFPAARPRYASASIALTALFWLIQAGVLWILMTAIDGHRPNAALILGLVSVPILVGMLSPIPGGAGIREALMVAIAGVHGANEASVLLAGVTYRIALFAALPVIYIIIRTLLRFRGPTHGTIPLDSDRATGTASPEGQ